MSAPTAPKVPTAGEVLPTLQRAVDLMLLPGQEGVWAAGLLERARTVAPQRAEVASVVRLLERCREALERAGLSVPGAPEAPAPTAPAPTSVPRGRRVVSPEVKLRPDGRVGMTSTPFSIKDVIKALPGARWDKAGKAWHIPATPACVVPALAAFDAHGVTARISPKVRALAEELYGLPERRKLIDPAEPVPEVDLDACALTVTPWEHQTRGLAFLAGSSAALLAMPMGPQPVDTPVLTPKGWRQLGDLTVGDEVYGSNGRPARITGTTAYGERPVYRVTLSDGTSTRATGEHRWAVRRAWERFEGRPGRVLTTEQIMAEGLHSTSSRSAARHFLPDQPVIETPDVALPVPAYTVGALLGDGWTGSPDLSLAGTDHEGVFARVIAETTEAFGTIWRHYAASAARSASIVARRGGLARAVADLVLGDRAETKRIPQRYLTAGADQRLALLRGLLDTDGSVGKSGRIEFCSVSERLAADVALLARSLGAVVREGGPSAAGYRDADGIMVACQDRYRVTMAFSAYGPAPFHMGRKAAKWASFGPNQQRRRPPRSFERIEPDGLAEVCCIELADTDDRLYLTDAALIPTHNSGKTITTIGALNAAGDTRVIVVCPKRVKGVWRREFATKSDRAWHVVDGTRRNKAWRTGQRKRLDLDVPARVREMDETLFDCACGAAHAVVINYDTLTDPAIADWVPQTRVDTIVYDEVHKIKNHRVQNRDRKTEIVTKTVSGVAADWVPYSRRRIGLTGTPIAQTPLDIFGQFRALDPGIFGTKWQRGAESDPNTTPEGFRDRYAVDNPHVQGMVYKDRFNNLTELAAKFRSITYRPSVDLKTPGVTHQTFRVELDAPARKVYDRVRDEFYADLAAFAEGQETSSGNIMTALLRLQQLAKGTLVADPVEGPDGRMLPGEHVKVWDVGPKGDRPSPTGEALIEALDQVGCTAEHTVPVPVVVYCRFRSDLDQVREIVERRGLRYAELSGRKDDAIDNETGWMRTDCDVAGVQIQAGGTGIELTRSHVAVWWSIGYSLVDFDQASKRQDRPGQTEVVTNIYLITDDTADEQVYKALDARRSTVAEVFRLAGFSDPVVRAMVDKAQAQAQDGETVDGYDGCEREEVDAEGRVMRSVAIPWLDDVFTGRTVEVWPGVPV